MPITTKSCEFEPCSWWGVLDTTLCDKVCQWLATGRWFSPILQFSSTVKTVRHNITDILMTVALNTINQNQLIINNYLLLPQHKSLLSCVRITEQSTPQHTLLGWKCSGIGTGKGEAWESWVPSPSLPLSPLPQENTSCSLVTAITWDAPQDIWVTSHPNNASTIFAWKINVSYDLYYNFLYTVIQI